LNHSSHRVLYGNKTYPTAMHLYEAMKFIEHKPDLGETIRQCEKIEDVYPAAMSFQVWVRPDWGTVFLDKARFFSTLLGSTLVLTIYIVDGRRFMGQIYSTPRS
jgi:hypothetical protein